MTLQRAVRSVRSAVARRAPASALIVLLTVGWPGGVEGATMQAYCATALSTVALAAISPGAEDISALVRSDGHSECAWSVKGQGESNTLSLTFWERRSMADALVPADSPEEFFEIYVKSAEGVRGKKREALPGVGQHSALFRDGKVRELYLLTKTGVAHLVTDALTDAQMEAVARVVAAP